MKTCPTCHATYPDTIAFCARDGTSLKTTGRWDPGTVVRGRYRILSKIGEGGMGAVYKAKHTGFDELRAIKVLNADLTGDEKFHQRFKQEAYITRKLHHPNAVRVEDIDEAEDGSPFIVMEYIEGRGLDRIMQAQGPMAAGRVCAIAKQVAAALDAAHRLGMVHRDIKPENIVLIQSAEGETAKVLDFGIARVKEGGKKDEIKGVDLTGGGYVIGTPMYISPEQAQGKRGDDLDGRSDLYSLGIVMYQMLTGQVPFKSPNTMYMLMAHIQEPPTPIRLIRPDLKIPEPLANLVMRLLQKKRELRPASAAALIEELTRIEAGTPVLAPPVYTKPVVPAAPRGSGTTLIPSTPAAPRPAQFARPGASAYEEPHEAPRPFYLRPSVLLIFALLMAGGIWYHSTHRPADEIARHQAAAVDFEGKQLYAQAAQEYRAAIQIDANNAGLQSGLGHVLLLDRKWDDAISALREAVSLQPDDAVAHNNLGVALQTVGNVAEAIPEFREAVRVKPDYLEAHANLGHALEKQNDLAGSITEYHEVLRLKPDDAEAHFHLALANYKRGNSDAAVNEYREAIRLQPGFALAHLALGGVLFNRGERDAGIEELRTAYSLAPDDPEIRAAYQKLLEK
ncbi:MAG: tetratricopeptide repeat protein [Acidobacteriota bacterium]|nr:tetratricopeptide repeat protein [Acidobacteriota bacterium]